MSDPTPLQVLQQAREALSAFLSEPDRSPQQRPERAKKAALAIASIDACLGAGLPAAAPAAQLVPTGTALGDEEVTWRFAPSPAPAAAPTQQQPVAVQTPNGWQWRRLGEQQWRDGGMPQPAQGDTTTYEMRGTFAALASPAPAAAPSVEPVAYAAKNPQGFMTLWWPGEVARVPLDGCELIPLFASPTGAAAAPANYDGVTTHPEFTGILTPATCKAAGCQQCDGSCMHD